MPGKAGICQCRGRGTGWKVHRTDHLSVGRDSTFLWGIRLKKWGQPLYTEVWALSLCRAESLKVFLKEDVIKNTDGTGSGVRNGAEVIGMTRINQSRGIRRSIG